MRFFVSVIASDSSDDLRFSFYCVHLGHSVERSYSLCIFPYCCCYSSCKCSSRVSPLPWESLSASFRNTATTTADPPPVAAVVIISNTTALKSQQECFHNHLAKFTFVSLSTLHFFCTSIMLLHSIFFFDSLSFHHDDIYLRCTRPLQ